MTQGIRYPDVAGPPSVVELEIDSVPTPVAQSCPAISDPAGGPTAGCESDSLFPPPAGQSWIEYSTLPMLVGDGSVDLLITARWPPGSRPLLEGEPSAIWVTNDGDTLYGDTVEDLFGEGTITCSEAVPALSWVGVLGLGLVVSLLGARRLRRT